jgi:2-dehydropantoate 2-reductase
MENPTITIAGCGALGSLLAARLIEGGVSVQAYQRPGDQLDALKESGITIIGDRTGEDRNFKLICVSDSPSDLAPSQLIIVLVKSYNTESVFPVIETLAEDGVVLTLQNGLGNAEKLVEGFSEETVAAGVDTYGAHRISPGVIGWGGDGYIILGPWHQKSKMVWIKDLLAKAGLNASYVDDPRPAIWRKLAINAMVNTTAALTRMRNGELLNYPPVMELMNNLGKEAVIAANRAGILLDFEEIWKMHLENLERTASNRPSMLQDIEANRQTEIEAISGGVLNYARDDQEFPYTRAVYGLLKTIDLKAGF